MRLIPVALALAVTASACSHEVRPATPIAVSNATYEFDERVAGSDRTLRGTVRVVADTAIVEVETDPCLYDMRSSNGLSARTYRCGDVTYRVDRYSGDLRLVYTFYNTVTRKRTVCTQYTVNAQGQQVCTRTAVETVEQQVPVSGQLHTRAATE